MMTVTVDIARIMIMTRAVLIVKMTLSVGKPLNVIVLCLVFLFSLYFVLMCCFTCAEAEISNF